MGHRDDIFGGPGSFEENDAYDRTAKAAWERLGDALRDLGRVFMRTLVEGLRIDRRPW